MDTTKTTTHISLCSGYGGIDLGLRRAVPDLRTVAYAEIEAFAIANLVSKMEAGLLDAAPIWPDLKTFPWESFRDRVDILSGGYPCQPFSAAGQRKGKDDPRHLWPWIAEGIRILRPGFCFFENVEGHISMGLSSVISDLEEMGYRTTWGIFSAAEVGAPHQRKRVFILAHRAELRGEIGHIARSEGPRKTSHAVSCGQTVADSTSDRFNESLFDRKASNQTEGDTTEGICAWPSRPNELADASSAGYQQDSRGLCSSEGETWISVAAESQQCGSSAWPSRPGEQQYAWEPPRVISGLENTTGQRSWCESGDALHQGWTASEAGTESLSQDAGWSDGAAIADHQPTGGDGAKLADSHRIDRSAPTEGREYDRQVGPAGEELGDTGCERQEERQVEAGWSEQSDEVRHMADSSVSGSDGRPDGSCRWSGESGEAGVDATGSGSEGDGLRQTQPPLGGDTDGPAGGLDYAELCVTCDNRTDELRLLGNGVVPATATIAFRTLIAELLTQ